jgi:hypothetical protein
VVCSAVACPSLNEICVCRPASEICSTALAVEPAGFRRVGELAAAHSEVELAAAKRVRFAVAEQARCAVAADGSHPADSAAADLVADDSSQAEVADGCLAAHCSDDRCVPVAPTGDSCRDAVRDGCSTACCSDDRCVPVAPTDDSYRDAARDGCSAACCSDDRCVPVVPTGDSYRDAYSAQADLAPDDWAAWTVICHSARAARTHDYSLDDCFLDDCSPDDCSPADCSEPVDSVEGENPDWADSAPADCSADLAASGCWVG